MENTNIDNQISNLMQERRTGFNEYTKKFIKNDNQESNMTPNTFDDSYFLGDENENSVLEGIYSASGKLNDNSMNLVNNLKKEMNEDTKKKALELESLIVDALVRERFDEASRYFRTLAEMKNKYDNDNINDIFYRVQAAMPKRPPRKNQYSFQNNKNNFREVLNALSNTDCSMLWTI